MTSKHEIRWGEASGIVLRGVVVERGGEQACGPNWNEIDWRGRPDSVLRSRYVSRIGHLLGGYRESSSRDDIQSASLEIRTERM